MSYFSGRRALIAAIAYSALSAVIAVAQTSTTSLPPPKFLYSSDFQGNKVFGYMVNATTGALKATSQGSAPTHTGPTRVASDKGGYRLYVVNSSSKDLSAYFINRTDGSLHGVPGSPFSIGQSPTDVRVHPSGSYVYVTAKPNWIYAFHVQSNGSLAKVPGSPFPSGFSSLNQPETLAIDPAGKYLYVSSFPATGPQLVTGEVAAFSINSTDGALTPLPGSPYTEPSSKYCTNGAWDMGIHPSGKFLILPSFCEGLVVYRIGSTTGTLSLVKGSPFPPPVPGFSYDGNVEGIAMDPQGVYFWVTDEYCHSGCAVTTDTWRLNTTTGVPSYLESGLAGCGLLARPDPSGKFVYQIGDTTSNFSCGGSPVTPAIWGLNVNRTNGALKNISGSPWASPNADWFLGVGLAITP